MIYRKYEFRTSMVSSTTKYSVFRLCVLYVDFFAHFALKKLTAETRRSLRNPKRTSCLLSTVYCLLFSFLSNAQVYPVQGTATLIPPYALRLSDYTTSTADRFVLNVLLADVSKADLHVRFRISITGQNVKLETKPEYIGSMITMQGGVPLRLTNMELAEYFDPNHLNFSGISKSDFLKTGILPEGFYQFCFEVYEYNRGVKISNTICAPAWLILNDPPLINLPLIGTKLKPLSPQNVMMQWTPRHTGSPNAAFTTEYEVKVVEVWPANRNPNDAILTQPAIYETTTNSTSLVYGPDATQLEPGRRYAFRVQAKAMTGSDHLDLFKNNGYSETTTFIYGDACDAPINITAQTESPTRFSLQWDASPSQTGYAVQYRVKDQPGANWYTSTSLITSADIGGLQPNTTYEYQVMSTCGAFESSYGNLASITTEDISQKGYSCGVAPNTFNLDPSQLIPILKVGDVVNAGDFDVTITKVTGATGNFSGEGAVVVPFLNQVRGRVAFDNITVNNDKRLVNGFMNITGGGIEIVPSGVLDAMDKLSQALSIADSALNLAREMVTPVPDPNTFVADTSITVAAGISKVYKDVASGNIIVVDNNGQTQSIPPGKNLAITDSGGKGVLVNKEGGVTNTTAALAAATAKREYNLGLTFAKTANSKLGFDEQKIEALKGNYEKLGETYFVSWKSVNASQSDAVNATFSGKGVDVSKIKFEQDGNAITATNSGTSFSMPVAAVTPEMPSSIVARATSDAGKEQVLGKLNVIGYASKPVKLHIVRVNDVKFDAKADAIKTQLDQIYAQAVVSWEVDVVTQSLKVDGLATPFDDGGSGLLSNYTGDMKAVINAFGDLKDEEYYLFLIDKPASGSKLGYMPRSKQAGFIFTEPNGNDAMRIIHTMAHELGHGAFTLKHTFAEYTAIAQGSTDNLMDYNNGSQLWKYQWDQIHDPVTVLGLFESDEAGASKSISFKEYIKAKLAELSKTGNKYFTIIHCDECQDKSSSSLSTFTFSDLIDVPANYAVFENSRIKISNTDPRASKIQFAENGKGKCLIIYYQYPSGQQIGFNSTGDIKSEISKTLLFFDGNDKQTDCTPFLGDWSQSICNLSPSNIFSTDASTIAYYDNVFSTILNCLPSPTGNSDLTDSQVSSLLQDLQSQARSNQQIEFLQKGVLFTLNGQSQLIKNNSPKTDDEINSGIWDDGFEMKMRLAYDQQGLLQFTALGIKKDLQIASGKTASLVEIALNMRLRNNVLLKKYQVKDGTRSPAIAGVTLDSDAFPDGKKVDISESASFFKFMCEAGGVGLTFLKTAKIEQPVYKEGETAVIKVPPIATGTLESVGMVVTDITSAVSTIHDLATDEQARNSAIKGLVEIKNQVSDDPTQLFPILTEVVVEEFTGSTPDEFSEVSTNTTDEGRKQHIIVKTGVRTASSVFASGKVIAKLPDMAKTVAFKLARSKSFLKFKKIPGIPDDALKKFQSKLKNLDDGGEKFLDDFKDVTDDTRAKILGDPDLVDNWKTLDDAGLDKSLKQNVDALSDPDATLDAVQNTQKVKPTWPEIQALWKRGNDFNKKGRLKYQYNEINLTTGKRLDSYVPGEEIISRKATTLSQIQPSTFEGYLKELTTKYKKGEIIRSDKYKVGSGAIDGQGLSGEYFLEIPTSNKSFFESSSEFQKVLTDFNSANGANIKIKYLDE